MAVDPRRELKHSKGNDDLQFRFLDDLHLHSIYVLFLISESLMLALSRMSAWSHEVSYVYSSKNQGHLL
jgi:hypothetical protein